MANLGHGSCCSILSRLFLLLVAAGKRKLQVTVKGSVCYVLLASLLKLLEMRDLGYIIMILYIELSNNLAISLTKRE